MQVKYCRRIGECIAAVRQCLILTSRMLRMLLTLYDNQIRDITIRNFRITIIVRGKLLPLLKIIDIMEEKHGISQNLQSNV